MSAQASYEGVLLVGAPRSGTTLLRRLFNAHPNICCPPETNLFGSASRFLMEERFAGGASTGVRSGLAFSGIEPDEVLTRTREFVFVFMREICQRECKTRWAEKTAFDAFHLDQIDELCGDQCRFVCLFRHPLDVVCSIKELTDKMEVYLSDLHPYVQRYPAPLEAFAHAWVDIVTRQLQLLRDRPETTLRVQYEQLVESPEAELTRIFDFLGEPTDVDPIVAEGLLKSPPGLGDWKRYEGGNIVGQSVNRWHELLDETVGRLAEIVNPIMEEAGYEPVTSGGQLAGEDARRLLQLSMMIEQMKADSGAASGSQADD